MMKPVALLVALSLGSWIVGCTFASPTTSTYNAGKVADAGLESDGGTSSTSSSGAAAGGSTDSTASGGSTDDGATCCKQSSGMSAGTCIPMSAVPSGDQSDVIADTCASGNVCIPTDQVNNTPKTCSVVGGLFKGVCLGTCFSEYLALGSVVLKSDDCDADDVCVPCDAASGKMLAGCSE